MRFRTSLALPLACWVVACASNPAIVAAERGDRAALKSAILSRESTGSLSNGDAAAIAGKVASREIRQARPDDAPARVREVAACARELDDALSDRMKIHDEAGALAALARLDAHVLGAGDARDYHGDREEHWRAVGARGLVRDDDRADRLRALLDTSPYVRRQAVRAAHEAADPADLDALAETVRVDPEPVVRTEAVRAIAALPAIEGPVVARRLHDLWSGGDEPLREDIAIALAAPEIFPRGGRDELLVVLAQDHGPAALEAAAAVLRLGGTADRSVADMAVSQLARAIESGPESDRLHALAIVDPRLRPELAAAVDKASKDDDVPVRIAALGRLAEDPAKRAAALTALEALAGAPGKERTRALLALGSAGDLRGQKWMEDALTIDDATQKLAAASALALLGKSARAAPLLADEDVSVRTRAACTVILGAAMRPPS